MFTRSIRPCRSPPLHHTNNSLGSRIGGTNRCHSIVRTFLAPKGTKARRRPRRTRRRLLIRGTQKITRSTHGSGSREYTSVCRETDTHGSAPANLPRAHTSRTCGRRSQFADDVACTVAGTFCKSALSRARKGSGV